jgi:hypothetical protein
MGILYYINCLEVVIVGRSSPTSREKFEKPHAPHDALPSYNTPIMPTSLILSLRRFRLKLALPLLSHDLPGASLAISPACT